DLAGLAVSPDVDDLRPRQGDQRDPDYGDGRAALPLGQAAGVTVVRSRAGRPRAADAVVHLQRHADDRERLPTSVRACSLRLRAGARASDAGAADVCIVDYNSRMSR